MFLLKKYSSDYCHCGLISRDEKKLTLTIFSSVLIASVKEQIFRGYSAIPEVTPPCFKQQQGFHLFYSRSNVVGFTSFLPIVTN